MCKLLAVLTDLVVWKLSPLPEGLKLVEGMECGRDGLDAANEAPKQRPQRVSCWALGLG